MMQKRHSFLTVKKLLILLIALIVVVGAVFYFNRPYAIKQRLIKDPETTYGIRFYQRGSACGVYINDHLFYDSYEDYSGMESRYIGGLNAYLNKGDNNITLKIRSQGDSFRPGATYKCFAIILATKNNQTKRVGYLNLDYARVDYFTRGDTDSKAGLFKERPVLAIERSSAGQRVVSLTGILNIPNLKK